MEEIYNKAHRLGACPLFKGGESVDELFDLFVSPQGIEFCARSGYPSLEVIRSYKDDAARHQVYVDEQVVLSNPGKVILANCEATLTFDDAPDQRHEVVVLFGSKVTIEARNYAVVCVTVVDGEVTRHVYDDAIIT